MLNWLDSFLKWASAPWDEFWKWVSTFWIFQWIDSGLNSVKAAIRVFTNAIEGPLQFLVNWSFVIVLAVFVVLILVCVFVKKSSLANMRHVKTLAICGLFMALNVVLGYFTVKPSPYLEIGLGSITQPIVATLYGPLTACVVGLTQDVVKFIIHPTGTYIPALTLLAGIGGMIYGIFFYGKKVTFGRALIAKLVVNVFVNMILYSISLAPTMSIGIAAILPARILKNLITWPIFAALIYYLIKKVQRDIPKKLYY